MKTRPLLLLSASLLAATASTAATITYDVQEAGGLTTLTITGDPAGESSYGTYGRLYYDTTLATAIAFERTPIWDGWLTGGELGIGAVGDGTVTVFNDIVFPDPGSPTTPIVATLVFDGTLSNWGWSQLYLFDQEYDPIWSPNNPPPVVPGGGPPVLQPAALALPGRRPSPSRARRSCSWWRSSRAGWCAGGGAPSSGCAVPRGAGA